MTTRLADGKNPYRRRKLLPSCRGSPPAFSIYRRFLIAELSIFVDESGSQGGHSRYCIVSLVFHDQRNEISPALEDYRARLDVAGLPDYAFHASPLMYGKPPYDVLELSSRKRMLSAFESLVRQLPFRHTVFAYKRNEVASTETFVVRLRRDLAVFLADHLEFFQSYDAIKIYYDDGQGMVTSALHGAIEYMLSRQAVMYRMASQRDYRLAQVADYLCTLKLTELKFESHELTSTDEKVFGSDYRAFKKNHLKQIRKKGMD